MRVLVCGGRDYADYFRVCAELDDVYVEADITCLIHGAARGADTLGGRWAEVHGVPVAAYPADWAGHGKRAGYLRNKKMLDEGKPDLVLAFPGGRGTADMVRQAQAAGVYVIVVTE